MQVDENRVVDGENHSGRFREALFRDNEHFPSDTFPNFLEDMSNIDYFQNRAILAPKNSIVNRINEYVLDLLPREEIIYLSYDSH